MSSSSFFSRASFNSSIIILCSSISDSVCIFFNSDTVTFNFDEASVLYGYGGSSSCVMSDLFNKSSAEFSTLDSLFIVSLLCCMSDLFNVSCCDILLSTTVLSTAISLFFKMLACISSCSMSDLFNVSNSSILNIPLLLSI